ncbi:MAG: LTA synthase family protein [Clostridia bacterium]|nr:LTA synthase family protein [Clostridia bacterium]
MLVSHRKIAAEPSEQTSVNSSALFSHTFYRYFTVSTTLRRLIAGGVLFALLLTLVLVHTDEFLGKDVACGGLLYGLSLAAVAVLGTLTMLRWGVNSRKVAALVSTVVVALLPIVAMTMAECLNGVFTWDWSPRTLMLNYVLYMLFYGTVYVCSGSYRLPMLVVNPLIFLLALTNHYVYAFRGTPFVPMDLFAATTAANVATAYDFSPNYQIVISILLLVFLLIAGYKLYTPAFQLVGKLATRVFFSTLTVTILCIYLFTDQYAQAGLAPDFWNQARGYHRTGVVMNFCLNTKYVNLKAPGGYDAGQTDDLMAEVLEEDADVLGPSAATAETVPNIICIMNESLANLNVLGDLQTNIEYMPFLNSLTENTIRGNLYVPVIGSGTSNTEFEFLTGVSTSFFPAGSNAYMLYVKEALPSLVSTLMEQGYSSHAFHPYYASGWNRRAVYDYFGFSRFTSLGSIVPNSILSQYAASGSNTEVLIQLVEDAYPGENTLLRRYVSDSRNYREVINLFENRNRNEPFFLFNVTMQNHGGYTEQASNFEEQVWVTGLPGNSTAQAAGIDVSTAYPKTNQFLSLMKYSDDAFAELIAYFEQVQEPTVICMFGDHQPSVENSFIQELMGVDSLYSLSAEAEMQRYVTPFYIWANYDIPEQTIERLSVNYLSSYVLQTAGVALPAYNRYLLKLSETLPVIHAVGCYDADGVFHASGNRFPYAALLDSYERIAYNYIIDSKGRQEQLYRLAG